MDHYIIPIILKKPSNVIFHVRTNDVKNLPSRKILENLLQLKKILNEVYLNEDFLYQLRFGQ